MEKLLEVRDLSISLYDGRQPLQIIQDMNFYIKPGEIVGVVGESGCGKSITAQSIIGLVEGRKQITGEILFEGKNLLELSNRELRAVRGREISMIFQEPMTSLNPTLTVGYQLMEAFRVHNKTLSHALAYKLSVKALHEVNIPEPEKRIRCYPHELSGGMRQRVMIAMALSCRPKLMIADEPTTALDVTIQAQILDIMKQRKKELGTAVMLITHDLGVVAETCSRILILYCGRVVEEAPVKELFSNPRHPYTRGLLKSLPEIGVRDKLFMIEGNVPSTGNYPDGCPFHPRCHQCIDRCRTEHPSDTQINENHRVNCWLTQSEEGKDAV